MIVHNIYRWSCFSSLLCSKSLRNSCSCTCTCNSIDNFYIFCKSAINKLHYLWLNMIKKCSVFHVQYLCDFYRNTKPGNVVFTLSNHLGVFSRIWNVQPGLLGLSCSKKLMRLFKQKIQLDCFRSIRRKSPKECLNSVHTKVN